MFAGDVLVVGTLGTGIAESASAFAAPGMVSAETVLETGIDAAAMLDTRTLKSSGLADTAD
jgi:hypothetical protein